MKKIAVLALALLFSISFAAVAFAYPGSYVVAQTGNNSGWISNGQSGYYWSGDKNPQYALCYSHRDYIKSDNVIYAGNNWRSKYNKIGKFLLHRDYNRDGAWYYYKDDRGKAHYFYIDPNREGQWERYIDRNGDVQFRYVQGNTKTIKNHYGNVNVIKIR